MNFYKEAAKMIDTIESKKGSVKGCLSLAPEKDRKRLGALIIETLKLKPAIISIIHATPILRDERRHLHSHNFALVLVHDLLFAPGGIQAGDGPIKQAINRHKTRLQAELVKLKIRNGAKSNSELAQANDPRAATIPRYLRVNRNKWSTPDAIKHYASNGYMLTGEPGVPAIRQFRLDTHVPDLLIFNSEYDLHSDQAFKSGKLIAQDKASCFPALVLNPPSIDDAYVIDATAAPGNKTSHLSALMRNKGKIYAFERNQRRFKTLEQMLRKSQSQNVEAVRGDFLEQDPLDEKFTKVTHILVDPSCSGSGIVNRLDYLTSEGTKDSDSPSRLQALAAFQKSIILHAMRFPAVTRVVYSTCSIHAEENEAVVQSVLQEQEVRGSGFCVAHRSLVLPTWTRRGLPYNTLNSEEVDALVRCSPGEDSPGTNGFFVACFVKEAREEATLRENAKRRAPSLSLGATSEPKKRRHG